MVPTVMKVFLSDDPSSVVEVPITPNTTASDVIECCKEPGETSCHLAELWRGKERCVSENEKPYTILQQWGSHAPEVRFCLRHYNSPLNETSQKQSESGSTEGLNAGYIAKDGRIMTPNGIDMTLTELKEIAQKQQQQIELQQQTLVGKEQRLRFLKQQMQQQQALMGENEKLRRLREKAEAQEAKLRKIRALRGKVDQQRYENTTMSSELEAVHSLFEEKHLELSGAMLKVQELTNQLDELRKGRLLNNNVTNHSVYSNKDEKGKEGQSKELEKLKNEMMILNRMNEEQQKRLDDQRGILKKRNEDASDLDRRIEELTNRLRQKKLAAGGAAKEMGGLKNSNVPTTRMHTIVAAVEPVVKQTEPNVREQVSGPPLKTGMYSQDLAYTGRSFPGMGRGIVGRIDQAPAHDFNRGQPEGINHPDSGLPPYLNDPNVNNKTQVNRDFYNKSMPPASKNLAMRPQSAMAQLFPEPSPTSTQESLTAKVRPMFSKMSMGSSDQPPASAPNSGGYYPINMRDDQPQSPAKAAPGGINLFAYKPPPSNIPTSDTAAFSRSNVTVLPSGNIKYNQSRHPPPPYSNSIPEHSVMQGQPAAQNRDMYGNPISSERSITVDIEALRRKFAHAPRPLKKRSSITEPERPQGPVIPKLLYDQIYKKADTPFYRPPTEQPKRSTPPPAYVEPNKAAPPVLPKPNKTERPAEANDTPVKAVSYESNITPTEFLRQRKILQREEPSPEVTPETDDIPKELDDNQKPATVFSNDKDSSSELSYNALPPLVMPDLNAVPTKGILKPLDAASKGPNRRIRFDPLALLLDASLEGEFNLVKKIIDQVPDPSGANDEGITALHNAVCASHFELVKFLVHYGSDVNASDTDGWTPLHCSASCNNLLMSRFLVENGACIFAATLSDGETAADKCEELDEGYLACSEYLYGIQEKLGVVRNGQVYALYDYKAENDDELSFRDGDLMTVIRRGDGNESEWWWAALGGKEGYIPRNLIGMWPRIKSKEDHE